MAGLLRAVLLGALACVALAGYPNAIPCPGPKGRQGQGASCKEVKLPDNLCTACYLRDPAPNGNFKDCSNIYNTQNSACMDSMNKYVEYNQCDGNRKKVMNILNNNPNNARAREDLDYFVYSVCEQCCDCIPMGASQANVGATVPDRGNCPAHAWYDVCAVMPQFTHFINIGEDTPGIFKNNPPSACKLLAGWKNSDQFPNWQKRAKVKMSGDLRAALNSMVKSTSCSSDTVWNKCFNLESKQKNLGNPGTFDGTGSHGNWNRNVDNNNNKNVNCNNGDCSSNTSSNTQTNSSNGEKKCGECKGTVKPGCTNWDAEKGYCTSHGPKCFPSDGSQSYSVEGCGGSHNNSENNSENNGGNNSKNDSKNNSVNSSNSNGEQPNCKDCPGKVMYGCTHYDAKKGVCTSTGQKCFPKSGSNNGYGCQK